MKTLLKAGLIYPVTSAPIKNGCVAVSEGEIEALGPTADFSETAFDRVIDLTDHILTPGFVNAHSHLQLSAARDRMKQNGSFTGWIRKVIEFTRSLSEDERNRGIETGVEEMMRSGITAVADIVTNAAVAERLLDSAIRSVIFVEAIGPLEYNADEIAKNIILQVEKLRLKGAGVGISPHSAYTVSGKLFGLLNVFAGKEGLPVMMHIAETGEEDEFVRNGSGELHRLLLEMELLEKDYKGEAVSSVGLLSKRGLPDGLLAVHLNLLDTGDMEILADKKIVPVFCPSSSRWFGRSSVMPIDEFLSAGVNPAIGTDSLASNSSLSMLDELRCAAAFFPLVDRSRLMEMATVNGAKGLSLNCGAIEKGKWADIIGFKWNGDDEPLDSVFGAKKADFVMIDGDPADNSP